MDMNEVTGKDSIRGMNKTQEQWKEVTKRRTDVCETLMLDKDGTAALEET